MKDSSWYDKCVIKILFLIAKIISRYGGKSYGFEIGILEKEIFNKEEGENN